MGGGFTVDHRQLDSAASVLQGYALDAKIGSTDLDGNTMPAPAAGRGIGADVKTFVTQWQDLFSTLSTEFTALSKNCTATSEVYVTVEEANRGGLSRMNQFAE